MYSKDNNQFEVPPLKAPGPDKITIWFVFKRLGWFVLAFAGLIVVFSFFINTMPNSGITKRPNELTSGPTEAAVEFGSIRSNMNTMTSVAWDDYTRSLKGQRVSWTGWVSDVEKQWFGGFKILVDMDPPGSLSVQDVYIEDIPKSVAVQFRKNQKVRFSGKIKSVMSILGSCVVMLEDVSISPAY